MDTLDREQTRAAWSHLAAAYDETNRSTRMWLGSEGLARAGLQEQTGIVRQALDALVLERSRGRGDAVLSSTINVGVGVKADPTTQRAGMS